MFAAALVALGLIGAAPAQLQPDEVERLAKEGWTAARAAAVKGGSPDSLAPARRAVAELEKPLSGTALRLQREYARSLISAAMAAAQDERGEMELHLTQARDLSDRLELVKQPAVWPLAIDEAEGELWLEVDRYAEAVKAYRRAAARPGAVSALLGLARSAARTGDHALACDSYRRWLQHAPADAASQEARDHVARCAP